MVAFLLKTKVIELRVSWPTKQAERSNAFASFVFSGSANDLRGFEGKYKHGNSLAGFIRLAREIRPRQTSHST
jgi:hypothetical protein